MGTYFPQGLILQHDNIKEADRLLSVFTLDHGLIKVIARGARKITSKLAGNLEPITLTNFMVIQGRYYDTVASSEPVNIFRSIKNDLSSLQIMQYICLVIHRTYVGNQGDQVIYKLLIDILDYLEKQDSESNNRLLIWFFVWRYISHLGYQPELYNCLNCQNKILVGNNFFNYQKGGLVCHDCHQQVTGSIRITNNSIKILRIILNKNISDLNKIFIDKHLSIELDKIVGEYLSFVTEQDLRIKHF